MCTRAHAYSACISCMQFYAGVHPAIACRNSFQALDDMHLCRDIGSAGAADTDAPHSRSAAACSGQGAGHVRGVAVAASGGLLTCTVHGNERSGGRDSGCGGATAADSQGERRRCRTNTEDDKNREDPRCVDATSASCAEVAAERRVRRCALGSVRGDEGGVQQPPAAEPYLKRLVGAGYACSHSRA